MIKVRSKKFITVLLLLSAALLFCSCKSKEAKEDKQKIILTTGFEENEIFFIGNSKCYLPELMVYIRSTATGYERVFGSELYDLDTGDTTVSDRLVSLAVSRLAQVKVMDMIAAERGLTLSDSDLDRCERAAERYMSSLSKADVADMEVTQETLDAMYRDYALAYKVYEDITGDINPEISDDEARTVIIKRLLINTGDQAKDLLTANNLRAQALEGTDFDTLIEDYGSDPTPEYSIGKDTDIFPKNFVDICFSLSTGDISEVIPTSDGASLVKCISSYDMEDTERNKAAIVKKRKAEAFDAVYDEYVKGLYSDFNTELWENKNPGHRLLDTETGFFDIYTDIFPKN